MPPPNSFFLFSPSLLQKWGPLPKSQFSVPHMSHTFQQIRKFRKQQKTLNLCSWFYCNWCWFLTATTSSWKSTYQIGLSLRFAFVAAGYVFFYWPRKSWIFSPPSGTSHWLLLQVIINQLVPFDTDQGNISSSFGTAPW